MLDGSVVPTVLYETDIGNECKRVKVFDKNFLRRALEVNIMNGNGDRNIRKRCGYRRRLLERLNH